MNHDSHLLIVCILSFLGSASIHHYTVVSKMVTPDLTIKKLHDLQDVYEMCQNIWFQTVQIVLFQTIQIVLFQTVQIVLF